VTPSSVLLQRVLDPATTAVLTMEQQNGVVGAGAILPALRDEVVRTGLLDVIRGVCDAARTAGIRVVHCTHETRADGAGATVNCKIFARSERARIESGVAPTAIGSVGAAVVDGLLDPRDIVVPRLTGMTPFMSTSLDQILRNIGIRTVVATGTSLNLGIVGLTLNALDLGYQVVVVRNAVAGIPAEYGEAVLDNSLSLIATIVTAEQFAAYLEQTATG
jgi:nicotinamidase-related amidase